jgi:hypothetical protein
MNPLSEIEVLWSQGGDLPLQRDASRGIHAFEAVKSADGALIIATGPANGSGAASGQSGFRRYRLRAVDPRSHLPDLSQLSYLLAVHQQVAEPYREEVRRWLDEEHSAAQLGVEGTHWYLGYEGIDEPQYFLNLWGLADPSIIETKEWAAARDTPWRARIQAEMKQVNRATYRPVK